MIGVRNALRSVAAVRSHTAWVRCRPDLKYSNVREGISVFLLIYFEKRISATDLETMIFSQIPIVTFPTTSWVSTRSRILTFEVKSTHLILAS